MSVIFKGKNTHEHRFHIVDASPWPFTTSISLATMLLGVVLYFHSYSNGGLFLFYGLFSLIYSVSLWWRDVIREGTFEGYHTEAVQTGLRLSVVLFIFSEVCFFATFFWSYFHSSLAPTIEIGNIWPPVGLELFSPWGIPFLNTAILLTSGVAITWAHYVMTSNVLSEAPDYFWNSEKRLCIKPVYKGNKYINAWWKELVTTNTPTVVLGNKSDLLPAKEPELAEFVLAPVVENFDTAASRFNFARIYPNSHKESVLALYHTIALALIFLAFQMYEYSHATFTIADGIYGTTFYMLTGFHGLHVLVGTIFLIVCAIRHVKYHFTKEHHIGLEAAIWYWHFVDVVWLFLFISIYWWGGA